MSAFSISFRSRLVLTLLVFLQLREVEVPGRLRGLRSAAAVFILAIKFLN